MRRAYSYIRFSDRRQMAGDSLRRQMKLTEGYCERKGLHLDDSLNLRDLGVSGFRGKNADTGALSLFLEAIRQKRVPVGSTLIVENLDRVSRNEIDEALPLFMSILKAGISVVTVEPEREYSAEKVRGNVGTILEIVLHFVLANEESRKKSERVQEEWRERLKNIDQAKLTARAPAWLRLRPDRTAFELIPDAANAVRRIFQMAEDGYGIHAIARKLHEEQVPSIGRGKSWHLSYLRSVLTGRAAIGEFQSYTGKGKAAKPFGPPVAGYFPAVVTEAQFYRVQQGLRERKKKVGRRGVYITNLFSGLLRDARDGGPVVIANRTSGERCLVSAAASRGEKGADYVSFPYTAFEGGVLKRLREVRAADILPASGSEDAQARIDQWSGRVCDLEHKIGKTRERIDREQDIDVYLDLLADLERQRREAVAERERAKQESVSARAESFGEVKSLANLLDDAEDDEREGLRIRLRAKIADVVEEVVCYFSTANVPGSRGRIYQARAACVQIYFRGNPARRRDFIIIANPRTGWFQCESFARVRGTADLDIRTSEGVKKVEKVFANIDLSRL